MWKKLGTFKLGYEAAAKDAWVETERLSDTLEVKEDIIRDLLTIGGSNPSSATNFIPASRTDENTSLYQSIRLETNRSASIPS